MSLIFREKKDLHVLRCGVVGIWTDEHLKIHKSCTFFLFFVASFFFFVLRFYCIRIALASLNSSVKCLTCVFLLHVGPHFVCLSILLLYVDWILRIVSWAVDQTKSFTFLFHQSQIDWLISRLTRMCVHVANPFA